MTYRYDEKMATSAMDNDIQQLKSNRRMQSVFQGSEENPVKARMAQNRQSRLTAKETRLLQDLMRSLKGAGLYGIRQAEFNQLPEALKRILWKARDEIKLVDIVYDGWWSGRTVSDGDRAVNIVRMEPEWLALDDYRLKQLALRTMNELMGRLENGYRPLSESGLEQSEPLMIYANSDLKTMHGIPVNARYDKGAITINQQLLNEKDDTAVIGALIEEYAEWAADIGDIDVYLSNEKIDIGAWFGRRMLERLIKLCKKIPYIGVRLDVNIAHNPVVLKADIAELFELHQTVFAKARFNRPLKDARGVYQSSGGKNGIWDTIIEGSQSLQPGYPTYNPTKRTVTLPELTYYVEDGILVDPNGEEYQAISGMGRGMNNPDMESVAFEGPIPLGDYDIVTRKRSNHPVTFFEEFDNGRNEWFSLYRRDNVFDDSTSVGNIERGNFRLHPGRISAGCITLKSKNGFSNLREILNKQVDIRKNEKTGAAEYLRGTLSVKRRKE